jgi:hypothetical protein
MAESSESEDGHEKIAANRSVLDAVVLRVIRNMGHCPGTRFA